MYFNSFYGYTILTGRGAVGVRYYPIFSIEQGITPNNPHSYEPHNKIIALSGIKHQVI